MRSWARSHTLRRRLLCPHITHWARGRSLLACCNRPNSLTVPGVSRVALEPGLLAIETHHRRGTLRRPACLPKGVGR